MFIIGFVLVCLLTDLHFIHLAMSFYRILNWLIFGNNLAQFADRQSTFVQHMMGVPVFFIFGFLVTMEMLFGSSFAPSALLLGGAGLAYKYQQSRSSVDVVKKVA